jgi:hypothetical protein
MGVLSSAVDRVLSQELTVALRDCVHYCGFRYGRGELNPYEQFAHGLAAGMPPSEVRAQFIDFLRHYRPRTLGAALGLSLTRDYPLWQLPWSWPLGRRDAWVDEPAQVVDVMTHFSRRGIPRSLVELECGWHEAAQRRMTAQGYRPRELGFAHVRVLQGATRAAYLVTDGNHRISALSALGTESLVVRRSYARSVQRAHAKHWPLVRLGMMALEDALAVFDRYHEGNLSPARAEVPAELVDDQRSGTDL